MTGLLTTPLDVVKTRLMTQGNKQIYRGVFDCVSKISKEEGASTLLQASLHMHHRSASLPFAASLPACNLVLHRLSAEVHSLSSILPIWGPIYEQPLAVGTVCSPQNSMTCFQYRGGSLE